MDKREILTKNIAILSEMAEIEKKMRAKEGRLPSVDAIKHAIELLKQIIFPGFFGAEINSRESRLYRIGINTEQLTKELSEQIFLSFNNFNGGKSKEEVEIRDKIRSITVLKEDGKAVFDCLLDSGSQSNLSPELVISSFLEYSGWDLERWDIEVERTEILYSNRIQFRHIDKTP